MFVIICGCSATRPFEIPVGDYFLKKNICSSKSSSDWKCSQEKVKNSHFNITVTIGFWENKLKIATWSITEILTTIQSVIDYRIVTRVPIDISIIIDSIALGHTNASVMDTLAHQLSIDIYVTTAETKKKEKKAKKEEEENVWWWHTKIIWAVQFLFTFSRWFRHIEMNNFEITLGKWNHLIEYWLVGLDKGSHLFILIFL